MIVPATRYRDCDAALAFLTGALGFAEHAVYRDADGKIMHVELSQGGGYFMFGPEHRDSPFGRHMRSPAEAGGETTSVYVCVTNVAGHFARAVAAGAEILMPLEEQPYGGQSYSVRDPEGHLFTFGEYHPEGDHGG
ncbi:VOC family protein [Salipiger abyssi]|uniref:VOC family protein n=1 Tax=Salipiger abyssi TaxID=1250539 RepID=UPI004059A2A0